MKTFEESIPDIPKELHASSPPKLNAGEVLKLLFWAENQQWRRRDYSDLWQQPGLSPLKSTAELIEIYEGNRK
jgi:hypothetical protein